MINQSLQIFQTLTAGFFGTREKDENKEPDLEQKGKSQAATDEEDASSVLYC